MPHFLGKYVLEQKYLETNLGRKMCFCSK